MYVECANYQPMVEHFGIGSAASREQMGTQYVEESCKKLGISVMLTHLDQKPGVQ